MLRIVPKEPESRKHEVLRRFEELQAALKEAGFPLSADVRQYQLSTPPWILSSEGNDQVIKDFTDGRRTLLDLHRNETLLSDPEKKKSHENLALSKFGGCFRKFGLCIWREENYVA
jgi:hypothetical protein